MSGIIAGTVGASLISGYMASNAAGNAADAQRAAAGNATSLAKYQYETDRADMAPWREAGVNALGQMQNQDFQKKFTMADFQADPGYDFRMQEGQKALERSAAARGGLNGGATMKALTQYGQNFASNEYQNAYNRYNTDQTNSFNRLASIAGLGQTAQNQLSQSGQNYANNAGSNMLAAGNAQAAGYIGQSNAATNAIGQGMNTWMQYQMLNKK